MATPHPALLALAADTPLPRVGDPAALIASAREHHCDGLLSSAWSRGDVGLPKEAGQRLVMLRLQAAAQHQRLRQALLWLLPEARAWRVELAVAKGIAAQLRWYDHPGERPCQDLDVFAAPEDIERVPNLVRHLQPGHPFGSSLGPLVRDGLLQSVDVRVDPGVEVDLHTDLFKIEIPMRQLDVVWARTTTLSAWGAPEVRTLDPELSLVHFLLHLNKDNFNRLLGFVDVARILRRESLDWKFIEHFVRVEGLRTPVYESLRRVVQTLGLPVPPTSNPGGWRGRAWRSRWPVRDSLAGGPGPHRARHRQLWIPWLAEGRTAEAARWWLRRRVLQPRALLQAYYPGIVGPYLWQVSVGRAAATVRRRRAGGGRVA